MRKFDPIQYDLQRFFRMARDGEIPTKAVAPLANIFDAVRSAHIELGPGHIPIRPLLDSFPEAYIQNYLDERKALG